MIRELITTGDGSHTYFDNDLSEYYHSKHGAIRESQHVFIKHGLQFILDSRKLQLVHILEVGFGTGLNMLLTFLSSESIKIQYTAIEPYPLSDVDILQLNYAEMLGSGKEVFLRLHQSEWNDWVNLNQNFKCRKIKDKIENSAFHEKFNLVYFDAFAPQVQPELWTREIFNSMNQLLVPGGILMTYCAKGSVKRNLKSSGFKVEPLPGPPGKREITRAIRI